VERLDKLVADRLCVSRRDARAMIRQGAVLVNGAAVQTLDHKCAAGDRVTANGAALGLEPLAYIMLNKPAGVVCATRDNLSETVLELLPPQLRRKGLFPAGRLDKDTEGFVLITNDGVLAHRMLAPANHVPKTYLVSLESPVDFAAAAADFARGMDLGEGERTSPAQLLELKAGLLFALTIHEGMYHQVKRMFARHGARVAALKRTRIGGLELDASLRPGQARPLDAAEVARILQQSNQSSC